MLLLIPYRIESIFQHPPTANRVIIGITVLVSLTALISGDGPLWSLVLERGSLFGLPGHILLHGDLFHLGGNMLFLWIFGNALCSNMENRRYAILYVLLGVVSGLIHIIVDGDPAIGASGAINGIVGMAVTAYPRDKVDTFWWVLIRFGTTSLPMWLLVSTWLFFDLWGAGEGGGDVAHWAHIGGLFAGIAIGLIGLQSGWIQLTQFDKPTLLDMLRKRG